MKYLLYMDTPIGPLTICEEDGKLTALLFGIVKCCGEEATTGLLSLAKEQLSEYFAGKRTGFTVPLALIGTPFQKSVWDELTRIPYGQTVSYQDIASRIGKPKSVRAVGGANHHNPISIIVPCHRVIGKNGKLTGYGGGLPNKEWLLHHEQSL